MQEDYQGPGWTRLADANPPQFTLCDWVFAAETYTERGTGTWYKGLNASVFSTPDGGFISDPQRTYWKAVTQ
jgi:hypothetical protein